MGTAGEALTVLIVDDVVRVRESLRSVLALDRRLGVVGEAGNGREALEQARRLSPDVVLMDLEMPVLDGYAASEQIKRQGLAPAVVALSIHAGRESRERAAHAGVDAFVEKGTPIADLLRTIHEAYRPGNKPKVH